jgi:lysozyme family protein
MAVNDLTQLLMNPEITGLERQRRMAQALIQSGLQTPQGQVVGNRYVPVNPLEFIGNIAQQYSGKKELENIDKQELALAKALREQDLADLQQGMQLYQGTPAKTTELAGPYGQGVGAEGANIAMPTANMPEQAANPQAAMALLLGSKGPKSSAVGADLYKQMFREPKWEKSELPDANGNVKIGWVNVNSANPASTFILGGTKPDVEQAKGKWEGYLPQGGGFGVNSAAGNSSFAPAMAKVFSLEGEAFVPKDGLSGAPAKFGINQKANPDIDVKNLTKPQAEAIYKTRYWDAIGADNLPPKTAEIAFDAAVNQGPAYAKQLLAQTGGDPQKMLQQRAQDYTQLVQSDPRQAQYLPSWMNRLTVLSKDIAPQQETTAQPPRFGNKAEQEAWLSGQRKTSELKAEALNALPGAIDTVNSGLKAIEGMIGDTTVNKKGELVYGKIQPHAGFEAAVGMPTASSGFGISSFMPGSDINDFKARFKEIEGKSFLAAIGSLRGTGAISEVEGAKATSAINRMSLSQSEKEFVQAANDLKDVMKKGYEAAQKRAGVQPIDVNAQPSSSGAKLRWNPQTNSFVQ